MNRTIDGFKLSVWRREEGISRGQMATNIGISPYILDYVEFEKIPMSEDVKNRIEKEYEFDPWEVFKRTPKRKKKNKLTLEKALGGDAAVKARESCFAILQELQEELAADGLTLDSVWDYIKDHYKVKSRSELNRDQWTQLANRLSIAQNNHLDFDKMVRRIWKWHVAQLRKELDDAENKKEVSISKE